jgi:hypothetical protein
VIKPEQIAPALHYVAAVLPHIYDERVIEPEPALVEHHVNLAITHLNKVVADPATTLGDLQRGAAYSLIALSLHHYLESNRRQYPGSSRLEITGIPSAWELELASTALKAARREAYQRWAAKRKAKLEALAHDETEPAPEPPKPKKGRPPKGRGEDLV